MRKMSRSSHTTFRTCPRRFYWGYEKDGAGYCTPTPSMDLLVGLALHAGMEALLLTNGDIDAAVKAGLERFTEEYKAPPSGMSEEQMEFHLFYIEEQRALVEVLLRGWHRVKWSSFIAKYEPIVIEKERRTLIAPNVTLMSRCDALVRDKETGDLILINWKTTSSTKDWDKKWHFDVQAWTEALAEEVGVKEKVSGCLFMGFYKGVRKDGRQCTDLLYGYKTPSGDSFRYSSEYKKASKTEPWRRFPVWREEAFGPTPLSYWVNWLSFEDVLKYFPVSDPVSKDDTIMEEWLSQVVRLETEIEHILREEVPEEDRLRYFIQNFSHFNCDRCSFKGVCGREFSLEDGISSGRFVKRVDHHGDGEEEE